MAAFVAQITCQGQVRAVQRHSDNTVDDFVHRDNGSAFFDPVVLKLSLTMTSQSVVKHFLTEGDKLILSWFSPLQDQGGYAVAVNYGMVNSKTMVYL